MQTVNTHEYLVERCSTVATPGSTWINPYRYARMHYSTRRVPISERPYEWIDEMATINEFTDVIKRVVDKGLDMSHSWHVVLQIRFRLHPAIKDAVRHAPPRDRWQLVFEWPHVSETDPNRLAYTRDERSGKEDRQTITSVGKYLRRHFPSLSDGTLRDIAMRHSGFTYELWDTTPDIIRSVQEGPASCMQWDDGCDTYHPYRAYDPSYGWRAAVRLDMSGHIVGRCLVNVRGDNVNKIFVRSYAHKQDGYSHSDEALEVWLRDQGFEKVGDWEGCKLRYISNGDYFLAPYLDGDVKRATVCCDEVVIDSEGQYILDNTDGDPTFDGRTCDRCDSHVHEEDLTATGYHEDQSVCQSCLDDDYVYAYGRGGHQYYVLNDYALYCESNGEWYSTRYLADNDMVQIDDEIYPLEECVMLENRGEYALIDADHVVHCEHDDTYEHIDDVVELHDGTWAYERNTWQCGVSNDYYHDDDQKYAVEFSCLLIRQHIVAHRDAVAEQYEIDLDTVTEAIEALTTSALI